MPQAIYRDFRPPRRFRRFLRDVLVAATAAVSGMAAGSILVFTFVGLSDRPARPDIRADAAQPSLLTAVTRIPILPAVPSAAKIAAKSVPEIKTAAAVRQRPSPNVTADGEIADLPAERMRNLFDFFDGSQGAKGAVRERRRLSMTQQRSAAAVARIHAAHRAAIAGLVPPRT